jgi:hypothetical protein
VGVAHIGSDEGAADGGRVIFVEWLRLVLVPPRNRSAGPFDV